MSSSKAAGKPGLYVQYGCGWCAPEGWLNYDASFTLKWERIPLAGLFTKNSQRFPANAKIGDIVSGLPVPEESCQGVYASHVLEHLTLEDFHKAIRNTFRILRAGGIFRLVVPDLEYCAREYIARLDRGMTNSSSQFMRDINMGYERREKGLVPLARKLLGDLNPHLWMWDEISMIEALAQHGFRQIRRCAFGDCEDAAFAQVESAGRFENALAIEARR